MVMGRGGGGGTRVTVGVGNLRFWEFEGGSLRVEGEWELESGRDRKREWELESGRERKRD